MLAAQDWPFLSGSINIQARITLNISNDNGVTHKTIASTYKPYLVPSTHDSPIHFDFARLAVVEAVATLVGSLLGLRPRLRRLQPFADGRGQLVVFVAVDQQQIIFFLSLQKILLYTI